MFDLTIMASNGSRSSPASPTAGDSNPWDPRVKRIMDECACSLEDAQFALRKLDFNEAKAIEALKAEQEDVEAAIRNSMKEAGDAPQPVKGDSEAGSAMSTEDLEAGPPMTFSKRKRMELQEQLAKLNAQIEAEEKMVEIKPVAAKRRNMIAEAAEMRLQSERASDVIIDVEAQAPNGAPNKAPNGAPNEAPESVTDSITREEFMKELQQTERGFCLLCFGPKEGPDGSAKAGSTHANLTGTAYRGGAVAKGVKRKTFPPLGANQFCKMVRELCRFGFLGFGKDKDDESFYAVTPESDPHAIRQFDDEVGAFNKVFISGSLKAPLMEPDIPMVCKWKEEFLEDTFLQGKVGRQINMCILSFEAMRAFLNCTPFRQQKILDAMFARSKWFFSFNRDRRPFDQIPFLDLTPQQILNDDVRTLFSQTGPLPYYEQVTGRLVVKAVPGTAQIVQDVKGGNAYAISEAMAAVTRSGQHEVMQASSCSNTWVLENRNLAIVPIDLQPGQLVAQQVYGAMEDNRNIAECSICLDAPQAVFSSCGHGVCAGCLPNIEKTGSCPMCRGSFKVVHSTADIGTEAPQTFAITLQYKEDKYDDAQPVQNDDCGYGEICTFDIDKEGLYYVTITSNRVLEKVELVFKFDDGRLDPEDDLFTIDPGEEWEFPYPIIYYARDNEKYNAWIVKREGLEILKVILKFPHAD